MTTKLITALFLLSFSLAAAAQEPAETESAGEPREALERSMAYVSSLPALGVDIAMDFEMTLTNDKEHNTSLKAHLSMAGDDRARLLVEVPDGAMELFYAPDSKFIYLGELNQYVSDAPFGERQNALTLMPGREFRPAQILLSDFLHNEFTLMTKAEEIVRVPAATDAPENTEHIRVRGGGLVTDFWLRTGAHPVPEKFVMDMTEMVAGSNAEVQKATSTFTFSNWELSPEYAEGYFSFTKPEGATEFKPRTAQGEQDPLEGKPAPALELALLDGGTMSLASHKGKDVVILDFWASWCGPCRIGLPIVTEVSDQFKDKNVVFYAVNITEDRAKAKAFVEETGLTAPVALDTDGEAQKDYGASSIPMTVIIDKDGMVHEVHRGVSPALKETLTATLNRLTSP